VRRLAVITAILASVALTAAPAVLADAVIALVVGALLIAIAWTFSRRARPLVQRRSAQR
jgi:divalent metal cation (Fe/Co/Zn/Cd) transporter